MEELTAAIVLLVGRLVNGSISWMMGHMTLAILIFMAVLLLRFPFLLMVLGRAISWLIRAYAMMLWSLMTGRHLNMMAILQQTVPREKRKIEAPRQSLPGPPAGMNRELWVSKQLSSKSIQELIRETELDAECQWRKENDEHEGCPKCKIVDKNCPKCKTEMKPPAKVSSAAMDPIIMRKASGEHLPQCPCSKCDWKHDQ